ncbi:MAG: class C beta-lactamase-related serine hydrolase [Chitinophagaceae bacterium]|nr:MAG: class C beta-lactamase-related serine hydrolase [Chitinophagaceae bacterium]
MRTQFNAYFELVILLFPILFFAQPSLAQKIINIDSVSRNTFGWNQQEREFGFAHFDEIFNTREVRKGKKLYKISEGKDLAAFHKGGQKEKDFEAFMDEQKVAGIIILQDGKIRLERYALGYNAAMRWTSQSVAKSITAILVGAAIKDGYIKSIDDYVVKYLPDLAGSAYDKVTVRHLLTMTSGVKWSETYTDSGSDIVKFYTHQVDTGVDETVSYMRQLPAEAEPGKKWLYKTGETHLLGSLVRAATGRTLAEYLSLKIWIPFGMESKATWNIGRTSQEFAGCCLQMRLRDFARFGQFILGGARINGVSILPDGWLNSATQTQVKLWPGWGYGFQWWTLNDGSFRALGIHGQMIHIDPARRLVVVINSAWPEAESMKRQTVAENFLRSINVELDKEIAAQKNSPRN